MYQRANERRGGSDAGRNEEIGRELAYTHRCSGSFEQFGNNVHHWAITHPIQKRRGAVITGPEKISGDSFFQLLLGGVSFIT